MICNGILRYGKCNSILCPTPDFVPEQGKKLSVTDYLVSQMVPELVAKLNAFADFGQWNVPSAQVFVVVFELLRAGGIKG